MKVLFITRHYLDQMLGGPNCSKAFVHAVACLYPDMTLVYPEHDDHTVSFDFMSECSNIKLVPVRDCRSRFRKLVDVYIGSLHRFGAFVQTFLKTNHFDIIFIDHSFTASSGVLNAAVNNGAKIVTFHHNVESEYLRDNKPSVLFRFPYIHFFLRAERDAIKKSALNLTLTEKDKDKFVSTYPEYANTFKTIGVFEYEKTEQSHLFSKEEGNVFVLSGSMSAQQTETAVLLFIDKYMPVLCEVCSGARVIITGRNPGAKILDAAGHFNNITIIPNPENIMDEVVKGNYYICPLHTGGGLKLRCMDALRVGLPVLAHNVSACGYESMQSDGFLYSYSSVDDFRVALRKLLHLHDCHRQVAESYYSHFSFCAGMERMKKILSHL